MNIFTFLSQNYAHFIKEREREREKNFETKQLSVDWQCCVWCVIETENCHIDGFVAWKN